MTDRSETFLRKLCEKMPLGYALDEFLTLINPPMRGADVSHALWWGRQGDNAHAEALLVSAGGLIKLSVQLDPKTDNAPWKHAVTMTLTLWSQFVGFDDVCVREPKHINDVRGKYRRSKAALRLTSGDQLLILPEEGSLWGCVELRGEKAEAHEDTGRFLESILKELTKRQ